MVVPAPDGKLNPLVLAAAKLAGVDEIYRVGGAQAVAALAYGTADHHAGREDRRARQRLCRGGQAPGVRQGRHRHDRRPVGGADPRRQRRQSRLDRRRSAGAGRARRRRAVDPDHRRRRARRRGREGGRARSSRRCRAARSPARPGATSAPSSWSQSSTTRCRWSIAIAPEHLEIATRRRRSGSPRRIRNAGAIFLGAPHAGGDRRLCRAAPTTCCRPRARRASRRALACSTS